MERGRQTTRFRGFYRGRRGFSPARTFYPRRVRQDGPYSSFIRHRINAMHSSSRRHRSSEPETDRGRDWAIHSPIRDNSQYDAQDRDIHEQRNRQINERDLRDRLDYSDVSDDDLERQIDMQIDRPGRRGHSEENEDRQIDRTRRRRYSEVTEDRQIDRTRRRGYSEENEDYQIDRTRRRRYSEETDDRQIDRHGCRGYSEETEDRQIDRTRRRRYSEETEDRQIDRHGCRGYSEETEDRQIDRTRRRRYSADIENRKIDRIDERETRQSGCEFDSRDLNEGRTLQRGKRHVQVCRPQASPPNPHTMHEQRGRQRERRDSGDFREQPYSRDEDTVHSEARWQGWDEQKDLREILGRRDVRDTYAPNNQDERDHRGSSRPDRRHVELRHTASELDDMNNRRSAKGKPTNEDTSEMKHDRNECPGVENMSCSEEKIRQTGKIIKSRKRKRDRSHKRFESNKKKKSSKKNENKHTRTANKENSDVEDGELVDDTELVRCTSPESLHLNGDKDIIAEIMRVIIQDKQDLPMSIRTLFCKLQTQNQCMVKSEHDLTEALRMFPQCFKITDFNQVTAKTNLKLCEEPGCTCSNLHFCKYRLLDECSYNRCRFSHDINTKANVSVLQEHHLQLMDFQDIRKIVTAKDSRNMSTLPTVCKFYNNAGGCEKHEKCDRLNVCLKYITDDCKFGLRCKRLHDLRSPQPRTVLKRYGLFVDKMRNIEELRFLIMSTLDENGKIVLKRRTPSTNTSDAMLENRNRSLIQRYFSTNIEVNSVQSALPNMVSDDKVIIAENNSKERKLPDDIRKGLYKNVQLLDNKEALTIDQIVKKEFDRQTHVTGALEQETENPSTSKDKKNSLDESVDTPTLLIKQEVKTEQDLDIIDDALTRKGELDKGTDADASIDQNTEYPENCERFPSTNNSKMDSLGESDETTILLIKQEVKIEQTSVITDGALTVDPIGKKELDRTTDANASPDQETEYSGDSEPPRNIDEKSTVDDSVEIQTLRVKQEIEIEQTSGITDDKMKAVPMFDTHTNVMHQQPNESTDTSPIVGKRDTALPEQLPCESDNTMKLVEDIEGVQQPLESHDVETATTKVRVQDKLTFNSKCEDGLKEQRNVDISIKKEEASVMLDREQTNVTTEIVSHIVAREDTMHTYKLPIREKLQENEVSFCLIKGNDEVGEQEETMGSMRINRDVTSENESMLDDSSSKEKHVSDTNCEGDTTGKIDCRIVVSECLRDEKQQSPDVIDEEMTKTTQISDTTCEGTDENVLTDDISEQNNKDESLNTAFDNCEKITADNSIQSNPQTVEEDETKEARSEDRLVFDKRDYTEPLEEVNKGHVSVLTIVQNIRSESSINSASPAADRNSEDKLDLHIGSTHQVKELNEKLVDEEHDGDVTMHSEDKNQVEQLPDAITETNGEKRDVDEVVMTSNNEVSKDQPQQLVDVEAKSCETNVGETNMKEDIQEIESQQTTDSIPQPAKMEFQNGPQRFSFVRTDNGWMLIGQNDDDEDRLVYDVTQSAEIDNNFQNLLRLFSISKVM